MGNVLCAVKYHIAQMKKTYHNDIVSSKAGLIKHNATEIHKTGSDLIFLLLLKSMTK